MSNGVVNGIDRDALIETREAFSADPSLASFSFRVRNRWTGGCGSSTDVDDYFGVCEERRRQAPFHVASDLPAVLLGTDKAPGAVEYLLHAMASCLTTTFLQLATMLGLSIEYVEVRIEGSIDLLGVYETTENCRSSFQGMDVLMTVKDETNVDELADLCALAWRRSPVCGLVARGMPIAVSLRIAAAGREGVGTELREMS
jgi:uncharacterized OsmC-like protein